MAADAVPASAVVFAYHNVGVRSLRALLDANVDVRLVVTHADDPNETLWFDSVAALARNHGIDCVMPVDAADPALFDRCAAAAPDFVFSFYYRLMLPPRLLALARRGAYNVHGSLLPKYRGRAPVNWAVLRGERETGATLHVMDAKPDHGAIVDRCTVPILGDDTARQVFDKVTLAAEIVVARSVPCLVAGTAEHIEQVGVPGHYFGGRRPEDGRIPAQASAKEIHDLVRAVAPPEYPGAFFDCADGRVGIAATRLDVASRDASEAGCDDAFIMRARDGALSIEAAGGGTLRVMRATLDGKPLDAAGFVAAFGTSVLQPRS